MAFGLGIRKFQLSTVFLSKLVELLTLIVFHIGRVEWKEVAEKLGLTQDEIQFLDVRARNPAEDMLGCVTRRFHLTVGDLYDLLIACELPVLADLL